MSHLIPSLTLFPHRAENRGHRGAKARQGKHLLLLLIPLLFPGCDLFTASPYPGTVNVVQIGLSYEGTGAKTLGGTINDAVDLNSVLRSLYGTRVLSSALMLQDDSHNDPSVATYPTREHVKALIASLPAADLTILSYSGHGYPDTGDLCLPSDEGFVYRNQKLLTDAFYPLSELLADLMGVSGKVLLILDSCYSGNAVKENGGSVSLVERTEGAFALAWKKFFGAEAETQRKIFALTASQADTQSWENGASHAHGFFTKALLSALGWDDSTLSFTGSLPAGKGGVLTLDDLYLAVREDLRGKSLPGRQHPMLHQGPESLCLYANGN